MPILREQNRELAALQKALLEDISGVVDVEGRSSLDFLITGTEGAPPSEKERWRRALAPLIISGETRPRGWWQALERFVVLTNLTSEELGPLLETALVERKATDALDRASLYNLLDDCGKPPLASTVAADEELKQTEPLRWLDLMLARVANQDQAQNLVLESAVQGHFLLPQFIQNLDEMRSIGGAQLANWLRRFRTALPEYQQEEYDTIVGEAFGIKDAPEDAKAHAAAGITDPARLTETELAILTLIRNLAEKSKVVSKSVLSFRLSGNELKPHASAPRPIKSKALESNIALLKKRKQDALIEGAE